MRTKLSSVILSAVVLGSWLTSAEARAPQQFDQTWVPQQAWQKVKQYARQKYDPQARLSKTQQTIQDSRGLKGVDGSSAWIVRASIPQRLQPNPGLLPYTPRQAYFLVAKDAASNYQVKPLAGPGSYLSKVDAKSHNSRVGVGVGLFTPSMVAHGVQVDNALSISVTQGTLFASKQNGPQTRTVYVGGDTGGQQWAMSADATLGVKVHTGRIPGAYGIPPYFIDIPVNFSQILYAQPMGGGGQ